MKNNEKGDVIMKHVVQLKMPKLFGKKKDIDNSPEVTTEVDLDEVIKQHRETPTIVKMGGVLVVGLTVGYLVGFKEGVSKVGNVIVVK